MIILYRRILSTDIRTSLKLIFILLPKCLILLHLNIIQPNICNFTFPLIRKNLTFYSIQHHLTSKYSLNLYTK